MYIITLLVTKSQLKPKLPVKSHQKKHQTHFFPRCSTPPPPSAATAPRFAAQHRLFPSRRTAPATPTPPRALRRAGTALVQGRCWGSGSKIFGVDPGEIWRSDPGSTVQDVMFFSDVLQIFLYGGVGDVMMGTCFFLKATNEIWQSKCISR